MATNKRTSEQAKGTLGELSVLTAIARGGGAFSVPLMGQDHGIDVIAQLPEDPNKVVLDRSKASWTMSPDFVRLQVKNQQDRAISASALIALNQAFRAGQAPGFVVFVDRTAFDVLTPAGIAAMVNAGRKAKTPTVSEDILVRFESADQLVDKFAYWMKNGIILEWLRQEVDVDVAALEAGSIPPLGTRPREVDRRVTEWFITLGLWRARAEQLENDVVLPTYDLWARAYHRVVDDVAELAHDGLVRLDEDGTGLLDHVVHLAQVGLGLEFSVADKHPGLYVPVPGHLTSGQIGTATSLLIDLLGRRA